jgi:hypothetical protein
MVTSWNKVWEAVRSSKTLARRFPKALVSGQPLKKAGSLQHLVGATVSSE